LLVLFWGEIYKKMLKLNLPSYDYLVKKQNDVIFIFDIIRKKYILLSPEEWVRQHFLNFLVSGLSVPINMISTETALKYNKLSKRADILVFSNKGLPLLLVECKAPTVKLGQDTLLQLSIYNKDMKVPLLAITNGLEHYCWKKNQDKGLYEMINLPADYSEMQRL
jgi:hypothetical protein